MKKLNKKMNSITVEKKKKLGLYIFTGLMIVIIIILSIRYNRDERFIKSNYDITIGELIKYNPAGSEIGPTVRYKYSVNGYSYERTISVNNSFEPCMEFQNCSDNKFWVIYSPDNPIKSMINTSMNLKNIHDPEFPENLSGFEMPRWSRKKVYVDN